MSRPPAVPKQLTRAPFRGADAVAAGLLSRRQLNGVSWRRLFPDVYAHAGLPLDHLAWCRAAGLLLGTRGAVSGRSAACVWGADVVPRQAPVEVTVAGGARLRVSDQLTVVRSTFGAGDVARHRGIPVTAPVRTAFDVARRLPLVEGVVGVDALYHTRRVTPEALRSFATANPNWPGAGRLELVLALADSGAESPMETRLRLVLVFAGLPRPVTQYVVLDRTGRFVARLDLAYPELRLAIEYDGAHHRDPATFRDDLRRQNALRACGWTVLRFTAADIYRNPDAVVATVRAALVR